MARRATTTAAVAADEIPSLTTYKGFGKDWQCRGYQYALGETYEHTGSVVRCAGGGFHSCEHPLDTWNYYEPNKSRYAEVTVSGDIDRDKDGDSKIASGKITINVELSLGELTRRAVKWVAEMAKKQGNGQHTIGNYGHAEVKGASAVAHAPSVGGTATAAEGSAISLAFYDENVWPPKLLAVRSSMVGENGIEAGKRYKLGPTGAFEEVIE